MSEMRSDNTPRPSVSGLSAATAARTPPPTQRPPGPRERWLLGTSVVLLALGGTAIFSLPAPGDAARARGAPRLVAVATDSGSRADSAGLVVDSARARDVPTTTTNVVDTPRVVPPQPTTISTSRSAATTTPAPSLATPPATSSAKNAATKVVTAPPSRPTATTTASSRRRGTECERQMTQSAWDAAFAACTREARGGAASAQRQLGLLYLEGRGTVKSESDAAKWLGEAATAGDADAMWQFAVTLERGRGVPKDPPAALRWYTRAADAGIAAAQYTLGQAHEKGRLGARKDRAAALDWYRKAAAQGYSDAEKKARELSK